MAKLSNTSTANQVAFGQLGSAFADTAANTVRPPEDMAIIAIQFLGDTSLSSLVAKNPNTCINTAGAANDGGHFTRTVNQSNATTNKIIFDDTNAASGVAVGDEVYDSDGTLHGTVSSLDPDGDNDNEIQISASVAITDNEVLSFINPGRRSDQGIGGQQLASAQVFPKGSVIYGEWDSVSINADASTAGIICYFG